MMLHEIKAGKSVKNKDRKRLGRGESGLFSGGYPRSADRTRAFVATGDAYGRRFRFSRVGGRSADANRRGR